MVEERLFDRSQGLQVMRCIAAWGFKAPTVRAAWRNRDPGIDHDAGCLRTDSLAGRRDYNS